MKHDYENLSYIKWFKRIIHKFLLVYFFLLAWFIWTYLENKNFKLSEKEVISILKQILAGVFYLQQYGITHRDLKPENILVKKEKGKYIFKIADFGLSKIISPEEKCEEPYGTLVT